MTQKGGCVTYKIKPLEFEKYMNGWMAMAMGYRFLISLDYELRVDHFSRLARDWAEIRVVGCESYGEAEKEANAHGDFSWLGIIWKRSNDSR